MKCDGVREAVSIVDCKLTESGILPSPPGACADPLIGDGASGGDGAVECKVVDAECVTAAGRSPGVESEFNWGGNVLVSYSS